MNDLWEAIRLLRVVQLASAHVAECDIEDQARGRFRCDECRDALFAGDDLDTLLRHNHKEAT